jgi:hypothetical protein
VMISTITPWIWFDLVSRKVKGTPVGVEPTFRTCCAGAGRLRKRRFWPPKPPKFPAAERDLVVENPAAGNGIFECRDGRIKIGLRDRKGHRRPKERNDNGENPHRNGPF